MSPVIGEALPVELRNEYAKRNLKIGTVLRLHVAETNPPKIKRFIIVGTSGDRMVLATIYINSEVNKFYNYSIELQSQHLFFEEQDRDYLDHDSYIDCSKLIARNSEEICSIISNNLDAVIGKLSGEDLKTIKAKIIASPSIKGKEKKKYGFYE